MNLLALLLTTSLALADWQGSIHIISANTNKVAGELRGIIHSKGTKQRLDFDTPLSMSTIVDMKTKKAYNLIHAPKLSMEMDFADTAAQFPLCTSGNIEECLKKEGFKKTGSEKVSGMMCAIYEGKATISERPLNVKLWHPVDFAEVPAVKSITTDSAGEKVAETEISAISKKSQADALFAIPHGYKKAEGLQDLFK